MKDHKNANKGRELSLGGVFASLFPVLFLFAIFVAVGIVHVASRVLVMDAGYKLHKLESEHRRLTQDNDKLKLELATLRSPSRLEKIAREKLNMAAPPVGAVISVDARPTKMARASAAKKRPSPLTPPQPSAL